MTTKIDITDKGILDEVTTVKPFYNSRHLPPKPVFCSKNPSKTQISPLDAVSPQEVLDRHGMYRQESVYSKNPQKIYADLSEFGDFESNLNAVRSMQEKFNSLDPEVRARFNHSLLDFTKAITSTDFDIEKCLTTKEVEKFRKYKSDEKLKREFEAYTQSQEYKDLQAEAVLRQRYEAEQYEAWKSKQK